MKAVDFIKESNRIEGIVREPTQAEIDAHNHFVGLPLIQVANLTEFVSVYQSSAQLRNCDGMNVRVGHHIPPAGGMAVEYALIELLDKQDELTPFQMHVAYENLHPFTDGNGRSGRVLWAWSMKQSVGRYPLGFLHHFYYQSLAESPND